MCFAFFKLIICHGNQFHTKNRCILQCRRFQNKFYTLDHIKFFLKKFQQLFILIRKKIVNILKTLLFTKNY